MAFLRTKTESVKLISKVKSGEDGFGRPTYDESEIEVKGVLVEPLTSDDVTSSTDMSGKSISYKLHIPKGDTHTWENTFVIVRGLRCKTVGRVMEYINPPLDWNRAIKVDYYE